MQALITMHVSLRLIAEVDISPTAKHALAKLAVIQRISQILLMMNALSKQIVPMDIGEIQLPILASNVLIQILSSMLITHNVSPAGLIVEMEVVFFLEYNA